MNAPAQIDEDESPKEFVMRQKLFLTAPCDECGASTPVHGFWCDCVVCALGTVLCPACYLGR